MSVNTVEVLRSPPTTLDMWDELNREINLKKFVLTIRPNVNYRLRLLGPFVHVRRLFIPRSSYISDVTSMSDLKSMASANENDFEKLRYEVTEKVKVIANNILRQQNKKEIVGDKCVHEEIKKSIRRYDFGMEPVRSRRTISSRRVSEQTSTLRELDEILTFIEKIPRKKAWQATAFVNGIVKQPQGDVRIKIIPFIRSMCFELSPQVVRRSRTNSEDEANSYVTVPINGFYAHDLKISKTGTGVQTSYSVSLSREATFLNEQDTNYVLGSGLLDIPSIIRDVNEEFSTGYLYQTPSNYKMPDKFVSMLEAQLAKREEDIHIESVESEIDKLPPEAFEGVTDMSNPISSLEL
jgi:hypothetical protein